MNRLPTRNNLRTSQKVKFYRASGGSRWRSGGYQPPSLRP
jgi:hypothetical protein